MGRAFDRPDEADALFAARRLAYPALERLGPVVTEDVCVPREHVPAMLARIEALANEHGVHIANIAHAGDGNLHPLLISPHDADEAFQRRIHTVFEAILDAALSFGGTVTGEHGVGLLKRGGLERELRRRYSRCTVPSSAHSIPLGFSTAARSLTE